MGSYNSFCAITGLPITCTDSDLTLVYYAKTPITRSRTSGSITFFGSTFKGTYDDYGTFQVQENPLFTVFAPDETYSYGFLPISLDDNSKTMCDQLGAIGLDLSKIRKELLYFYHEVLDRYTLHAITTLRLAIEKNYPTVDFSSSSALADAKTPTEVKEQFAKIMKKVPIAYNDRAQLVYKLLEKVDEQGQEFFMQFIKKDQQIFDKDKFFIQVLEALNIEVTKFALAEINKIARDKLFVTLKVAAMHTTAYNTMVSCARKQLGTNLSKQFTEKLKSKYFEYVQLKDSSIAARETMSTEQKRISRLLQQMVDASNSAAGHGYCYINAFFGKTVDTITPEIEDLAFFAENFEHGFAFSNMGELRQYEGVAHIKAQANAVLLVFKDIEGALDKKGKWDTYTYTV